MEMDAHYCSACDRWFIKSTWGQADERAVGEGVAAVGFEVDWDGAEDGLQVLLLFQATGRL